MRWLPGTRILTEVDGTGSRQAYRARLLPGADHTRPAPAAPAAARCRRARPARAELAPSGPTPPNRAAPAPALLGSARLAQGGRDGVHVGALCRHHLGEGSQLSCILVLC